MTHPNSDPNRLREPRHEPRRFVLPDNATMTHGEYLGHLYGKLIMDHIGKGGIPSPHRWTQVMNNPDIKRVLDWVAYYAPNIIPEPAPDAATLGIVVDCWRNTELEQAHMSPDNDLTNVVMAKLNIATTRAIRPFVTPTAVDWPGIRRVLLDSDRGLPDGRTVGQLTGPDWMSVAADIGEQITHWERVEAVVGSDATGSMLAVYGSSGFSRHWWGTSWWPELANTVFDHVRASAPQQLGNPTPEQSAELRRMLIDEPERLPDDILKALIYQPDGKGLSYTDPELPEPIVANPDELNLR
ncbi:hypothetical protein [Nocardia brasiliensis]|uniref:hypothetical protein n=1 Tax=Nocardia brasiliensis TaxID=37326 RepID=UPI003D8C2BD9